MNMHRLASTAFTAFALAAVAPHASAASTWNFGGSGCSGNNNATYGNTWTCGTGSTGVSAAAWSTATNTGGEGSYRTARLQQWSGDGFGVINRENNSGDVNSPEHSMDNERGTDLIALNFGQSVTLTSLTIGWSYNDSDISVLAYTGGGSFPDAPVSIAGKSSADLLASGWSLVGNYADLEDDRARTINAGNISSSWWLVSAFNTAFNSGNNLDTKYRIKNDYVKLLAVAGTPYTPPPPPPGVPEPGSLALAGIALAGAWQVRRRKAAAGA